MRGVPRSEVDRGAGLVDLARDLRRPVREYSLGMRQRLGVALAMMGQPRLLILDEPANGLDPAGIQDLRQMLLGLPGETGAAVVLSSHILAEVEQVAGHLVVIHQGRLRYQGPAEDLGAPGVQELMLRVGQPDQARAALQRLGFPVREADGRLWIQAAEAEAPRIAECLVRDACELFELAPQRASLEARFLALLEQA